MPWLLLIILPGAGLLAILAVRLLRQRREATLHGILNAVKETIWVFAPDGRVLLANETALRRFGHPAEQVLGRRIMDMTEPRLGASRMLNLAEVVRTGLPLETEDVRDGMRFQHNWYPILDRHGQVARVAVFSSDITLRRKTDAALEQAFQEAEEGRRLLQALMEHVPIGITIADAPSGTIRMVSRYGQAAQGSSHEQMTPEEVVQRWEVFRADGSSPLPPDELPLVRALKGGEIVRNFELVQRTQAGRKLALLCNAAPIRDASGAIKGGIVAWHDIGELNEARDALRQTVAELERSNRELAQFAYIASHDLQEPLRQVLAYVDRLRQGLEGKLDGAAAQYFAFVEEGAWRMHDLVRGLLDFARLGAAERRGLPVACNEALAIALANLQGLIREAGAEVTQDELPMVPGEATQLVQLFQNLVGNALKFSKEGVPPRIHVGHASEPAGERFWVSDNGIGIDPRHHEKIFGSSGKS